jgi:sialate O-acetylesterase
MIHPILNYNIRGVIWYQGESNRQRPEQYSRLFPSMIKNWRQQWNLGDFPFYFVQIAPYSYRFDTNTQSAALREAQLKTMLSTPNTGMAVTMDIGDSLSNHPSEKITVAKRLAYWALAKTYGINGISYGGPVNNRMTVKEHKAILTFDYAENGLTSFGKELKNFIIAGNDKQFHPAKAEIKGVTLEIWSEDVKNPVAVRYCWNNYALGTLFNTAGLPASSFRTDMWDN